MFGHEHRNAENLQELSFAAEGECPMRPIVFRCPVTNLHMISGILLADDVHDVIVQRTICIECPLCGHSHDIRVRAPRSPANAKAG
ncbi:MAG: hypothetical protein V7604_4774 [Hyphomicrobiales bacterium]|jgi:hypothetical protein